METNPDDDFNGIAGDPYSADILEPVEMEMDNSDEEQDGNGDSQQSLEQHDNINSPSMDRNNNLSTHDDEHDDDSNPNHLENRHDGDQHHRDDRESLDGSYDVQDDKVIDRIEDGLTERSYVRQRAPRIIQVLNVAPTACLEQLRNFFSFVGEIINIELYQSDNENPEINFKVCFVEFAKSSSVSLAQHLTNTVFIDRALIVLPYQSHEIPTKEIALSISTGSKYKTNFDFGVVSHVTTGPGGIQSISTVNPRLTALGLAQYPQLPITTDPIRLEEIRRTVYIGNLDSTLKPDEVLKFFNDIGEVKYIRMAGDDTQPTRFAFVEFTHQSSVANAVQQNGFLLGSRALKINHSNNAIVKPQPKIEPADHSSRRVRDPRSTSRDRHGSSRDRSRRYDRDRERSRRNRGRERYLDSYRRDSPSSRSSRRRKRSRDRDLSPSRRRSYSRDRSPSRRSRSPRDGSSKRRSRSRDAKRRTSRSPSEHTSSKRRRKRSRR